MLREEQVEEYWQENLKQTDPIKVDITQEKLRLAQLCKRKRGCAEGPSGSKEAGFPEQYQLPKG